MVFQPLVEIAEITGHTATNQAAVVRIDTCMANEMLPVSAGHRSNQTSIPMMASDALMVRGENAVETYFSKKLRSQWYGNRMFRACLSPATKTIKVGIDHTANDHTANGGSLMIWLSVVYRLCHSR